MAIEFKDGKVWIGGVWMSKTPADIAMRQSTRHASKGFTAQTASPLAKVHEELFNRYDEHRLLRGLMTTALDNEDEARRQALLDLDARVADYLGTCKVQDVLAKVRGIMQDNDLTQEAKQTRAIKELEALTVKVRAYFAKVMGGLMEDLVKVERLVDGALLPEPIRPAGQEAVTELRAAEIRSYLASLDDPGRMGAVLAYGEKAKLEALHAMTDCPNGRDYVDKAFLDNAKCAAIRAQGGEFLLDDLEDARNMLIGAASRASMVESLLWNGLGIIGVKTKEQVEPWFKMAQSAIDASNKWLTI
ncbi:MAG: hypothetical protein Q7J24_06095 [Desulfomicrobium sp.]|nr:hypothetical protein [Desulfomicrobium sp.]